MNLIATSFKNQFKNKLETLIPELELILETSTTVLYFNKMLPILNFLPLTIVKIDFENYNIILGKSIHKFCGQDEYFNKFAIDLISNFMVSEMDKNIEKFPKAFEEFKNSSLFMRYYEMQNNEVLLKDN